MKNSETPEKDPNKVKYLEDLGRAIDYLSKNIADSKYSEAIEELLHAADLLANLGQEVKDKPYPSLSELFETELTVGELAEFNELGDNGSERAIFLGSIHSRELERNQAKKYSNLRFRHENGQELTGDESLELKKIQDSIDKEEQKGKELMQDKIKSNPKMIQSAQAYTRADEVTKNLLGVLKGSAKGNK